MARALTNTQRRLLRGSVLKIRLLVSFYMDDGAYHFCDDVEDLVCEDTKYIGANGLASCTDIRSGSGLSAEPVSLIVDGSRLNATGYDDPAGFFRSILSLKLHQRRVDISLGIGSIDSFDLLFKRPVYAGKINNARIVDAKLNLESTRMEPSVGNLEITLDSLASRYGRVTARTRSHADQQQLDPTDKFFIFVQGMVQSSHQLYWGKQDPAFGSSLGGGLVGGVANYIANQRNQLL